LSEFENDLKAFVDAMEAEYLRHYPEKGSSWKNDYYQTRYYRYSSMPAAVRDHSQDDYLIELHDQIYKKWKDSGDISELIDLSLVQGMIWSRVKLTLQRSEETHQSTPKGE